MSVVLATAGFDHNIRFWDAPNGRCQRIIKYDPDSQVNKIEIAPDKQFIAAAGNPSIRIYEINESEQSQEAVMTLDGHTDNVTSIQFQPDGRFLLSGSEDGTIKVWDLRAPKYSRSFSSGSAVNSVALRMDRDEFVSGDRNGYVKVWDLGGNVGCINSLRPTAVGASYPSDSSSTSRPRHHPPEGSLSIQSVDISEDSRTLVAISNHGTVFVWDPSGTTVATPEAPTGSLLRPITKFRCNPVPGHYCLHGKISPDCRHLVTTSSDGAARLWDTATWELAQTLQSPKWIWDAAFCADSSYLVTASSDRVARLWNLRTSTVVREFYGHQQAVTCVALNDSSP